MPILEDLYNNLNDEKTTVNNLVGYCKTQLLDAGKRADYDFTCGNQVFADVRSKIERIASGTDRIIRPEQYKALLEECTKKGMPYDKAEYMIYKTAEQHKVTIVEPADNSSMQMCRFCGTLNSKGSRVCKSCGLPVIVVCPKCGSKNLTKIDRMNGYLSYSRVHGDTRLNEAKMAEIADRKSM